MTEDDPLSNCVFVNDRQQLADAATRWRRAPELAVDTEFERTRTFFAKLALVQLSDGETVWLVDPLAVEDLGQLWELLAEPSTVKVLHSASEDISLLHQLAGHPMLPLFDTQIAAGLCGLGASLSYQDLAQQICGVELSKSQTRSDWLQRPLEEAQLRYAALDVLHLLPIKAELAGRLEALGRTEWCAEDCARQVADATATASEDADRIYRDFKWGWKLDGVGRGVLRELVAWREQRARKRDMPRRHVLGDNQIIELARQQPTDVAKIADLAEINLHRGAPVIDEISAAIQAGIERGRQDPPAPLDAPLDREQRRVLKGLKKAVAERAEELELEPSLLAAKRDLLPLVRHGELPERLTGWRREVIGDQLLEIREELMHAQEE
ncbi:MAG: ribonuclease D [Xanthomonadales bacterium]|nr:ribonuclease D [Xanthomonadales bacterium]